MVWQLVWDEPAYHVLTEDWVIWKKKDIKDSVMFHGRAPSREAIKVKIVETPPSLFPPCFGPGRPIRPTTAHVLAFVDVPEESDQ